MSTIKHLLWEHKPVLQHIVWSEDSQISYLYPNITPKENKKQKNKVGIPMIPRVNLCSVLCIIFLPDEAKEGKVTVALTNIKIKIST